MRKLSSFRDFDLLRSRLAGSYDPRTPTIVISAGTCGQASGANDLIRITKKELLRKNLIGSIGLRVTGCHGFCEIEPSILIEPQRTLYPRVSIEDIPRIVAAVVRGEILEDLLPTDSASGEPIRSQDELPFYKRQRRTILSRNELVDPIRVYDYILADGYCALAKALKKGDPKWVVEEVKASGLRGRGGAGFPTGQKWSLLASQNGDRGKYIVCNADEGDPGAYMDRSVLEGNPQSIIEGMIIGGFATGATNGVIYVRKEYPLAIKHLVVALRQTRELGLLGRNILGSDYSFDIQLVRGEETALIASIEGRMGEPRQRPPYPVTKGINGRPTAINNVETWANVPVIIRNGAREFASIGSPANSGTKIFSLVGKVKNTGLIEVPMGIRIGEVIHEIGGGPSGSAKIKAVQTGGPSGGCIPSSMFDLSIDYDSLAKAGSIMGSGGMIVMDENTCMIDVTKYFMGFLKDESCGKCFTCRKGTQRMWEILDDISAGRGTITHLDLLEELALVVKDTTMCGLGQSASNPVLATLRYFREEYLEHIVNKHCEAGVCKYLVGAPCHSTCPIGTEAWRYIAHIARGEYAEAYHVIREANPFPSICARVCNHPCESKCRAGTSGGQAIAIRALKRFVTDRADPMSYVPTREKRATTDSPRIAVVGAGPAGLTAAHYLSLKGYRVTVIDAERKPGGMMFTAIPAYRLPREVIEREIEALLDENISLKLNTALGGQATIDGLFRDGFKAIFLALGAHKSKPLRIEGENSLGVYPSIHFLRSLNVLGKKLAKGSVGVIGGGNSALDSARAALRQEGVSSVTIFYRRTRAEMPAYEEEVEAALQEGIKIETLVTPVQVLAGGGQLTGIRLVRNTLGDLDASGRRKPTPVSGSEFDVSLDTLVVAISESSDIDCLSVASLMKIETDNVAGTVVVNAETLATNRPGVFAGGDIVTGPNTIVDAIAAGKKAAVMIDRYVRGEELKQPARVRLPEVYIEPLPSGPEEMAEARRVETPRADVVWRKRGFAEVEMALTVDEARREAARCLRCDLDFTKPPVVEEKTALVGGEPA